MRVNYVLPSGALISDKDKTVYVDFDADRVRIPTVLYPIDSLGGERFVNEERTITAEIINGYLLLPKAEPGNDEYTDIFFYGTIKQKPLQTLLEIGDEVDFKKVLVVESSNGCRERIIQDIWDMYEKYHRIYGDNGEISRFNEPIWKVISKL